MPNPIDEKNWAILLSRIRMGNIPTFLELVLMLVSYALEPELLENEQKFTPTL